LFSVQWLNQTALSTSPVLSCPGQNIDNKRQHRSREITAKEESLVKITRASTWIVGNPWKNWLFVRLDTDQDGLYGIGEGTINGFAKTTEAAVHELAGR